MATKTESNVTTNYGCLTGMSTKIGQINNSTVYIGGAPRSKDLGQVVLFVQNDRYKSLSQTHYLTGEQFGANFGHDFAVVDLNTDGFVFYCVIGCCFYYSIPVITI
jgi:hypothetical protein